MNSYTYDEHGRLTVLDQSVSLSRGGGLRRLTTRFTFDEQGRLSLQDEVFREELQGQDAHADHHMLVFTYAPRLVRVEWKDENGVTEGARELSYDDSGRLSEERFSGAMAGQQGSIQYSYMPCDED